MHWLTGLDGKLCLWICCQMINIKEPAIIKNFLSNEEYESLYNYLFYKEKDENTYDKYFGRYAFSDPIIDKLAQKITPFAQEYFEDKDLLPSYSLFAHYQGDASLYRHVDDNACTYTLDMCVYQNQSWELGIEHNGVDKKYTLMPNEALAYYGNDQEHWRDAFPNKENQYVAMIFFHFVKSNHWYFTKGSSYLSVIRGEITEKQWEQTKQP